MSSEQYAVAMADLRRGIGQGQLGPAIQQFLGRLDVGKAGIQQWIQSAEELLRGNLAVPAGLVLEAGLNRWASSTTLRYLYGIALRLSGHVREAEQMFREVIAAEPTHADAPLALAFMLREQGRLAAASETVLALWGRHPRTRMGDIRTLRFLQECQRHAEAEEISQDILDANPRDAELLAITGEISLVLGRFGSARRRLRLAAELDPRQAAAWLRLAHTHKFTRADDPDLVLLEQAQTRSDLAEAASLCAAFGLGKVYDDLGERARAAQVLRKANAESRAAFPWDLRGWQRFVERQLRARVPLPLPVDERVVPVFIVGLPRSGTTLVASQLGKHPDVRNRSELNWIAALAAQLGPEPASGALSTAAHLYRSQLRQDDAPARCYVDKNPLNFRHLGLIAAMFPNARIIHCRRDLRDTALSLWSQHFAHDDMNWAYDFGDIGDYARGYQTLMEHWRKVLPLRVLELDYESLVANTAADLKRLFTFLGLPPLPAADKPAADKPVSDKSVPDKSAEKTPRRAAPRDAIATASVWQARQNVYASSVGRWKAYAPLLPEMEKLGVDVGAGAPRADRGTK
ncbi:tetratricopeptide repeat-containing sulfotransferase family protein [Tahibacter caeni]|uniref:tetratricopeptide repeat-containing sulfotransferase family protein n=1 Tax=Tahibacter caeni TaxID=1453545 RepID=UPI002148E9F3|nr:tetratricopeptide repeat-containing sulfotransferase family protein [Tahibacter caeni]